MSENSNTDPNTPTDPQQAGTHPAETPDPTATPDAGSVSQDSEAFKAAVKAAVEEALKPIKGKLEDAYKARDEAQAKVKERERADAEAARKKLIEDGKVKEAYEGQVSDLQAQLAAKDEMIVTLTRDQELSSALVGLEFRNDVAADMARRAIREELVKDESGTWKHRSGVSIRDYVATFAADAEWSFLFKPKVNSGTGAGGSPGTAPNTSSTKSLFDRPQADVLRDVAAGKIGPQTRF